MPESWMDDDEVYFFGRPKATMTLKCVRPERLAELEARIERLRAWGEYWHGCADAFFYERDGAPPLEPGDLQEGV